MFHFSKSTFVEFNSWFCCWPTIASSLQAEQPLTASCMAMASCFSPQLWGWIWSMDKTNSLAFNLRGLKPIPQNTKYHRNMDSHKLQVPGRASSVTGSWRARGSVGGRPREKNCLPASHTSYDFSTNTKRILYEGCEWSFLKMVVRGLVRWDIVAELESPGWFGDLCAVEWWQNKGG